MLPPLPRCSRWAYSSLKLRPSISAFPDSTVGSACTSSFSRFARRSLALRPAHSRNHQIRDRYPGASDISSPPCLPRLLPAGAKRRVGLAPTGKSAALSRRTWIPDLRRDAWGCQGCPDSGHSWERNQPRYQTVVGSRTGVLRIQPVKLLAAESGARSLNWTSTPLRVGLMGGR